MEIPMKETIDKLTETRKTLEITRNWSAVKLIDECIETACEERKKLENFYKTILQLP